MLSIQTVFNKIKNQIMCILINFWPKLMIFFQKKIKDLFPGKEE